MRHARLRDAPDCFLDSSEPPQKMKPKLFFLALAVTFVGWGCTNPRNLISHWIAPKLSGQKQPVKIDQTGAAQTPASGDVSESKIFTAIPANTPVKVEKDGTVSFTAGSATTVSANIQESHYTAPKAYAPAAPPTPAEVAAVENIRWFYIAGLVCALAAGLAAWSGHYLAAIKFGFAAVAVPVLARFFSQHAAVMVGLVCLGLGVGLILAWHELKAKYGLPDDLKAAASKVESIGMDEIEKLQADLAKVRAKV